MNDIDTLIEKAMADAVLFDTLIPYDVMTEVLEGVAEATS